MGQVAPAPYVPDKKLKVILRSNTSNTAQLDPEDKKYDKFRHARGWMEKSCMKTLQWHILVFHVLLSTIMLVVWAGISRRARISK
jgi:hypothetical protein